MLRVELGTHYMNQSYVPVLEVWASDDRTSKDTEGCSHLLAAMPLDNNEPVYLKGGVDLIDFGIRQLLNEEQLANRHNAQLQQQADAESEHSQKLTVDQELELELAMLANLIRKHKNFVRVFFHDKYGDLDSAEANVMYVRDYSAEMHKQIHIVAVRGK